MFWGNFLKFYFEKNAIFIFKFFSKICFIEFFTYKTPDDIKCFLTNLQMYFMDLPNDLRNFSCFPIDFPIKQTNLLV